MKIGDRLLDRLVKEVEARAVAESHLKMALERAAAVEAKAKVCNDENNRMTMERSDLVQNLERLRMYRREADPKLRELHTAAEEFIAEVTTRPRGSKARDDLASNLLRALRGSYDYCDLIPF